MQKKVQFTVKDASEAQNMASKLLKEKNNFSLNLIGENTDKSLNYEAVYEINLTLIGKKFLEGILKSMGIGYQIEARSVDNESEIHYIIDSYENSLLIGVKGRTLDALQTLVRDVISSNTSERIVVSLDIGGYRENRIHQLEILATKTAKEVAFTKKDVKLQAMSAFERRVIHEKLSDWRDVYTESEGEGELRAVVIKYKKKDEEK